MNITIQYAQLPRRKAREQLIALLLLVAIASLCAIYQDYTTSTVPTFHGRHLAAPATLPCDTQLDLNSISPGEVNQMRRTLAATNPPCYEAHFPEFASHFQNRIATVTNHLNLHIPKTGGTSFCSTAKRFKNTYTDNRSSSNCHDNHRYLPLWCCGRWEDRPPPPHSDTCAGMGIRKEFTMNENYLDHPLCSERRLYSILLRDPVDRAMSSERHFSTFRTVLREDVRGARLDLVRENYMTWALTSGLLAGERPNIGRLADRGPHVNFRPAPEDLRVAKNTLSRFDFLLEFAPAHGGGPGVDAECLPRMMELMGFGRQNMKHMNANVGSKSYTFEHDREQYEKWNLLDIELYAYGRELAMLDCDFFLRLDVEVASPEPLRVRNDAFLRNYMIPDRTSSSLLVSDPKTTIRKKWTQ